MLRILLTLALQDVDQVLKQGDDLLAEAKAAYEDAKAKDSVEGLTAAAFKLEAAKVKFAAVQEFDNGEKKKAAAERLQLVIQLARLINDAKLAISPKPAPPPPAKLPETAPPPVAPPPAPAPAAKPGPPDPAKQAEIEKSVRDLYKAEYARKAPADRRSLARTLMEEAAKPGLETGLQWVFLREAAEVAASAGDAALAVRAVDLCERTFRVEAVPLKLGVLASASKAAKSPDELRLAAEAYAGLAETSMAVSLYDAADKAVAAGTPIAKRAGDAALILRLAGLAKDVAALKPKAEAFQRAKDALARNPADPAANLEVGRFLCFIKGDWDAGLPHLAKGGDAALAATAARELKGGSTPSEQLAIADAWWDVGEKEKDPARSHLRARAGQGYDKALPGLVGVEAARVEKRLREQRTVDLLALIDLKQDVYVGSWRQAGTGLLSPPEMKQAKMSVLRVPYASPAEYDLRMVVECKGTGEQGFRSIDVGLVGPGGPWAIVFDGWNGGIYLNTVEGTSPDQNPSSHRTRVFGPNVSRTIVIAVRRAGVTVSVDGKALVQWSGDPARLRAPYHAATDTGSMFLATWLTYHVTKMELTPIGGELGRRTR